MTRPVTLTPLIHGMALAFTIVCQMSHTPEAWHSILSALLHFVMLFPQSDTFLPLVGLVNS
jgi:hypothetical protein